MKKIYIELSDICKLDCSFCPSPKALRGIMPLSLFERALCESLKLTSRIALHILGDPCCVDNLGDYLAIAHRYGAQIELVTSGVFFHKHTSSLLLNPPIYQLSISLEAGVDNHIAHYGEKIAPILQHHLHSPLCFLNLRIQDSNLYHNPSLLADVLRCALPASLLDSTSPHYHQALSRVLCSTSHTAFCANWHALFDNKGRIRLWEKAFLVCKKHFTWAGFSPIQSRHKSCYGLIEQLGILSNGIVVPCCIDTQGVMGLGNIANTNLETILESHRAKAIIAGFHRGIAVEKLCQNCGFIT